MPEEIDGNSDLPVRLPEAAETPTAETPSAHAPIAQAPIAQASTAQTPFPSPSQPYPYGQPSIPTSNGLATTGGVLGIVGFVAGWIPLIGILFGLVIGILAIVFSGIGLSRSGRLPGQAGKGMAITGLVLGILIVIFKLIPGVNLL